MTLSTLKLFFFTIIIAKLKSIESPKRSFVIVDWVSNFTLEKWLEVSKKDKNVEVLTFVLEIKTLLGKKVVLICHWFDKNGVKIDVIELLVCWES